MELIKDEMPLGGGEGSIISYSYRIGDVYIPLAESRSIRFSEPVRKWVPALAFLDDFKTTEDIKEALEECEDDRLAEYIQIQLAKSLPIKNDAGRWRALLNCGRIQVLGSSNLWDENPDNRILSLAFWQKLPCGNSDPDIVKRGFQKELELSRDELTHFADTLISEQ